MQSLISEMFAGIYFWQKALLALVMAAWALTEIIGQRWGLLDTRATFCSQANKTLKV